MPGSPRALEDRCDMTNVGDTPLRERLVRWTKAHLFKGASYVELIASATDDLARLRNRAGYVQFFTESFPTRLRSIGALVFLAESADGALSLQGCSPGLYLPLQEAGMLTIGTESKLRRIIESADRPIALASLLVPQAPEFGEFDANILAFLRSTRVEWLVSLMSTQRPQLIGMVALGAKETGQPYSAKEIRALSTLARTSSIAAENVLMFEALQCRVRELDVERQFSAALARSVTEAQEKERSRISSNIHDAVIQDLGITLQLLARLREHLQQALGALEDAEMALERAEHLERADHDRQVAGEMQANTSAYSEIWSKVRTSESILGALLGETALDLVVLAPGTLKKQVAAMPAGSQLDGLPVISGKYLVEDVLSLVRATSERLRGICTDLHPPYLDAPLIRTLSRSLQKLGQVSPGVKIDLKVHDEEPSLLGNNMKYLCKKITEQAVYNALIHARASRIMVDIAFSRQMTSHGAAHREVGLALYVMDNGRGFEPRTPHYWRTTHHHGLANMYETTTLIGGTLEIKSAPGKGTKVSLFVPSELPTGRGESSNAVPISIFP